jgi:uncharacterized membrane protein
MKQFSRKRHIAKTFTWRAVGTMDTILLSWLVSGDLKIGAAIGGAEVFSKLLLYYLHERLWYKTNILKSASSKLRHAIKTVSWRIVGTIDTMMMGWIVSGNPMTGLKIGGLELVTKMGLYYLHERVWYRSDYGLISETTDQKD